MKKGLGYIKVDSNDKNHTLSIELLKKGYINFELTYYPNKCENAGWNCEGYELPTWIGFTKKSALIIIKNLKTCPEHQ